MPKKIGSLKLGFTCECLDDTTSTDDEEVEARVGRLPGRPPKVRTSIKVDEPRETKGNNGNGTIGTAVTSQGTSVEDTLTSLVKNMEEIRKDTQECREWQQKTTMPERPQPRYQQRNYQRNLNQQIPLQSQQNLGRTPPEVSQARPNANSNFQTGWSSQRRFNPICYNCNERGHLMRECTAPVMLGQMQLMTSGNLQSQQQNRQEYYSPPPPTSMPQENYGMSGRNPMRPPLLKGPESLVRSNSQPQISSMVNTSERNPGNEKGPFH